MRIQAERRSPVVSKSLPIQFIAIFKVLIIRELFTSARNVKQLMLIGLQPGLQTSNIALSMS